ncbi:L-lysine 3-hydroxylase (Alpha-ketoglutarate-dependent dioxygenase) (KDO1) (L-lysine hydroxylase), partial [Durusdinium trenchii]
MAVLSPKFCQRGPEPSATTHSCSIADSTHRKVTLFGGLESWAGQPEAWTAVGRLAIVSFVPLLFGSSEDKRKSRSSRTCRKSAKVERTANVQRIRLDEEETIGFREDFFQVFEEKDFLWNALKDPLCTEKAVARSFKLVMKWLPEEALFQVLRLFVDARAAPAILISGLALDSDIPPTPALPGDFRLPVSEAWLLGLARCLGVPYGMLGFYSDNARGGLIRDLSPKPGLGGINQPHIDLGLHRDVPACVSGAANEPEGFILLALRGDPQHGALTRICSSQHLVACLEPWQVRALRRSPVQTQCVRTDSLSPYGKPFYAIAGSEEDPRVTFFYIPDHQDFSYRIVSDDAETEAAYQHALNMATDLADKVDLQAGDALLINNARCNHGRTAFEPQLDGFLLCLSRPSSHVALPVLEGRLGPLA